MKKRKITFGLIFKLLCLAAYVAMVAVILGEAAVPGPKSAQQSNAVGNVIADQINNVSGDQTKVIYPEKVEITNKDELLSNFVGQKAQLNVKITPEDATFQSIKYTSTNPSVISVDENGLISYLRQGTATIKIQNTKKTELIDEVTVEAKNIRATSINIKLKNGITPDEDGIYRVQKGTKLELETTYEPYNVTLKTVTYKSNNSSYVSVSSSGSLTLNKFSDNNITTITASIDGITSNEIKIIVEDNTIVKLGSIKVTNNSYSIIESQSKSVLSSTIKQLGADGVTSANYNLGYTLISSDTAIARISGSSIYGVKSGSTTVKVVSTYDNSIYDIINVEVTPRPTKADITSFYISCSSSITTKQTTTVSISSVMPQYTSYTTSDFKFESSDSTIATISSTGRVTPIKAGTVTITVSINTNSGIISRTKTITITEYVAPPDIIIDPVTYDDLNVTSFTLDTVQLPEYLKAGDTLNLSSYFKNPKFYIDGIQTTNIQYKQLQYISSDSTVASISSSTLKAIKEGQVTISILYKSNGLEYNEKFTIKVYELPTFKQNTSTITNKTLIAGEEFTFTITGSYELSISNQDCGKLIKNDDQSYTFTSYNNPGELQITAYAKYNDILLDYKSTLNIKIKHIPTTSLAIMGTNKTTNDIVLDIDLKDSTNNIIKANKSDQIIISCIVDESASSFGYQYESSNPDIAYVDQYGNLIINDIGQTTITVIETISNLQLEFEVQISNIILIDVEKPFEFTGYDLKVEDNTYKFLNGKNAKVKVNFKDESTYTKATYTSSDEKIATIGEDGVITPHKAGKATITVLIDDGNLSPTTFNIDIQVQAQNKIEKIGSFYYQIRKGIGHFGAFLVLGILACIVYLGFLKNKKIFIAIPIIFISGYAIAGLSELIQLYVPGRTGTYADVKIDYYGYLASTIIICTIALITFIIKAIKKKRA